MQCRKFGAWHMEKITPPGDAKNVITVGAADRNLVNADFSSVGNTTDGRVKPDVMAVGVASAVAGNDGTVSHAMVLLSHRLHCAVGSLFLAGLSLAYCQAGGGGGAECRRP